MSQPTTEAPAAPTITNSKPAQQSGQTTKTPPWETKISNDTAPAHTASNGAPIWPEIKNNHPLALFRQQLPELLIEADYEEVYGIKLTPNILNAEATFQTNLILQKFLRANHNDLQKAKSQLLETLKWRKEFRPQDCAHEKFDQDRFRGLGYIVEAKSEDGERREVITFNVYGSVKDNKKTFKDLDRFLRWRVGLMERSLALLALNKVKTPIPDYGHGPDPHQAIQVHDYKSVSILRQDPYVKAASKMTIEVLGHYYPETLSRKFFVNVPTIMGWLFSAMKLVIAKETVRKFVVCAEGKDLATNLSEFRHSLPLEYGGGGNSLDQIGTQLTMVEVSSANSDSKEDQDTESNEPSEITSKSSGEVETALDTKPADPEPQSSYHTNPSAKSAAGTGSETCNGAGSSNAAGTGTSTGTGASPATGIGIGTGTRTSTSIGNGSGTGNVNGTSGAETASGSVSGTGSGSGPAKSQASES